MLLRSINPTFLVGKKGANFPSFCNRKYSNAIYSYNDSQREKILDVLNNASCDNLLRYAITKNRLKKMEHWKSTNGQFKTLTQVESIEGFSEKLTKKLFDSILSENHLDVKGSKIKGQILHPHLSNKTIQNCKNVLAVYVTINSVCWTLIEKEKYKVLEWKYEPIELMEAKRLTITDVLEMAWKITNRLPRADIYVMKGEATSLRAAGSDPYNPKMVSVNLQKAQLISMLVAQIHARSQLYGHPNPVDDNESPDSMNHFIYFLRPSLPFRLFKLLVGTEQVSTEDTVRKLFTCRHWNGLDVPEELKKSFNSHKEVERDMLGNCLLQALTFMELCIYKRKDSFENFFEPST